jgi:hypothetical protein
MKRFNLVPKSAWEESVQFHRDKGPLWHAFWGKGSTWWDLGDGMRIVSSDFRSEDREDAFNTHPAVVHLHHPVTGKTTPLSALLTPEYARNRFTQAHLDLLGKALGVTGDDTLETLNQKMAAVHPGCTIYPKPATRWIY